MFAFILQFKAYSLFLDMKTTSIAEGYRKYRVIETHTGYTVMCAKLQPVQ